MILSELIEQLQDIAEVTPDAEVRLATQPGWPLAFEVSHVTTKLNILGNTKCEKHGHYDCDDCHADVDEVVWIAEGDQCYDDPYAPSAVWENP